MISLGCCVIGLIFASFMRYTDPVRSAVVPNPAGIDGGIDTPNYNSTGPLYETAQTTDAGQAYIDALTFLVDSSTIGLRDNGVLSNGDRQVWATSTGSLPVSNLSSTNIIYPGDGSSILPSAAAANAKPSRLILMVGMDGLSAVDRNHFIDQYVTLVRSIQQSSPSTIIVVCSLPSVTSAYKGESVGSAENCREANNWVKQVCVETGVYFSDTGSAVCEASDTLLQDYAGGNNKTLNSEGLNQLLLYLRTHAV